MGVVVETNALFTKNSIKPIMAGKLPDNIHGLVHRVAMNQETILRATLAKDKKLAFTAFVNDPLVVNISLKDARFFLMKCSIILRNILRNGIN